MIPTGCVVVDEGEDLPICRECKYIQRYLGDNDGCRHPDAMTVEATVDLVTGQKHPARYRTAAAMRDNKSLCGRAGQLFEPHA